MSNILCGICSIHLETAGWEQPIEESLCQWAKQKCSVFEDTHFCFAYFLTLSQNQILCPAHTVDGTIHTVNSRGQNEPPVSHFWMRWLAPRQHPSLDRWPPSSSQSCRMRASWQIRHGASRWTQNICNVYGEKALLSNITGKTGLLCPGIPDHSGNLLSVKELHGQHGSKILVCKLWGEVVSQVLGRNAMWIGGVEPEPFRAPLLKTTTHTCSTRNAIF